MDMFSTVTFVTLVSFKTLLAALGTDKEGGRRMENNQKALP